MKDTELWFTISIVAAPIILCLIGLFTYCYKVKYKKEKCLCFSPSEHVTVAVQTNMSTIPVAPERIPDVTAVSDNSFEIRPPKKRKKDDEEITGFKIAIGNSFKQQIVDARLALQLPIEPQKLSFRTDAPAQPVANR